MQRREEWIFGFSRPLVEITDVAHALGGEDAQELLQMGADGTWLHPKVAVEFVTEIDRKLARRCGITIDRLRVVTLR